MVVPIYADTLVVVPMEAVAALVKVLVVVAVEKEVGGTMMVVVTGAMKVEANS